MDNTGWTLGALFTAAQLAEQNEAGRELATSMEMTIRDLSNLFFDAAAEMASMGKEIAELQREVNRLRQRLNAREEVP